MTTKTEKTEDQKTLAYTVTGPLDNLATILLNNAPMATPFVLEVLDKLLAYQLGQWELPNYRQHSADDLVSYLLERLNPNQTAFYDVLSAYVSIGNNHYLPQDTIRALVHDFTREAKTPDYVETIRQWARRKGEFQEASIRG